MSLQLAAHHLAAQGRGPDTTLVHMAPSEVHSLQALARANGGTLTVNPTTGLPEAGFLSSILPMIAGAGLSVASGGTLTPLMAAGLVGGGTALATGSLQKGLLAGLGAYGGAGIGSVIGNAGTGALSQAAGAPLPLVSDAGTMLAQAPASPVSPAAFSEIVPTGAVTPPAYPTGALGSGAYDPMGGGVLNTGGGRAFQFADVGVPTAPNVTPMPTPITPQPAAVPPPGASYGPVSPLDLREVTDQQAVFNKLATTTPMETAKAGLGAIADKPSLLFNKGNLKYGAAALAPMMFQEPKNVQVPRDTEQYRYSYDPGREMPPTRAGDVGEFQYFRPRYTRLAADGGVMFAEGGSAEASKVSYDPATQKYSGSVNANEPGGGGGLLTGLINKVIGNSAPTRYSYDPGTQQYTSLGTDPNAVSESPVDLGVVGTYMPGMGGAAAGGVMHGYAKGGISHLGDYSDGGRLLRGPGDGVSDSIPATIANKRPARLADGEFVVPARIVSELGNGSTEAGARKLYAMMDRVQKNRNKTVGKDKVAVNSRSEKLLPA